MTKLFFAFRKFYLVLLLDLSYLIININNQEQKCDYKIRDIKYGTHFNFK
jgi:hypothetical protein